MASSIPVHHNMTGVILRPLAIWLFITLAGVLHGLLRVRFLSSTAGLAIAAPLLVAKLQGLHLNRLSAFHPVLPA
jgi:hypothetical protein